MTLTLIEAAEFDAITLEQAKRHMNVTTDDDDLLISNLIQASVMHLHGVRGILGRCLMPTKYCLSLPSFQDTMDLPLPPVQSVQRINYLDATGEAREMDPASYRLVGAGDDDGGAVERRVGRSWPWTVGGRAAVQISFTAGYAEPPAPLVSAILMHVAHLYENREASLVGISAQKTPLGYEDLVQPYTLWAC